MPLAEKNFSVNTEFKRYKFDNPKFQAEADKNPPIEFLTYQYESAKNIYIVEIRQSDKQKSYRKNFGAEIDPNKYHRLIVEHFNL